MTLGEVEQWSDAEIQDAVGYCEKLANLTGKKEPPKAPGILRGRPRSNRPIATRH